MGKTIRLLEKTVLLIWPCLLLSGFSHDSSATADEVGVLDPYTYVLEDFEKEGETGKWHDYDGTSLDSWSGSGKMVISDQWATSGSHSARITFSGDNDWPLVRRYITEVALEDFEYLQFDIWNPMRERTDRQSEKDNRAPGDGPHSIRFIQNDTRLAPQQYMPYGAQQQESYRIDMRANQSDISGSGHYLQLMCRFPSVDYVYHIDNLRLTRNLGRHFETFASSLKLLEATGMNKEAFVDLEAGIEEEYQRLLPLPASSENLREAWAAIENSQTRIQQTEILISDYRQRLNEIMTDRRWTPAVRESLDAVDADLAETRSRVRKTARNLPDRSGFVRQVIRQIEDELKIAEAAAANLRTALPYASPDSGMILGGQHTGTFIKPYGRIFNGGFERIRMSGARGEKAGFQMVVFALDKDLDNVVVNVTPARPEFFPADNLEIYALGFANIGPAAEGTARRLLQWYPDIVYPAPAEGTAVPAGGLQPFVLEIDIPRDLEAGDYELEITADSSAGSAIMPVTLRVYDFEVPADFTLGTSTGYRCHAAEEMIRFGLNAGANYPGWHRADDEEILKFHRKGNRLFTVEHYSSWFIRQLEREDRGEEWLRNRIESQVNRFEDLGISREHLFYYGFDEVGPGLADGVRRLTEIAAEFQVPVKGFPSAGGWYDVPIETFAWWSTNLGRDDNEMRERIAAMQEAGGQAWRTFRLPAEPDVWQGRWQSWHARHWNLDGIWIYSHRVWTDRNDKNLDPDSLPYSNWHEPAGIESRLGSAQAALTYFTRDQEGDITRGFPAFRLWSFRDGLYDYEYLTRLAGLVDELTASGVPDEYEPLLDQARRLTEVPAGILELPADYRTISGEAAETPAGTDFDPVASMIRARTTAAELIEALSQLN